MSKKILIGKIVLDAVATINKSILDQIEASRKNIGGMGEEEYKKANKTFKPKIPMPEIKKRWFNF